MIKNKKHIKSYKHTIELNKEKLNHIEKTLYPEWCRVADILIKKHMIFFYKNNSICRSNTIYKDVKTFLTERYKDCINRQVVGLFSSKISNFKLKFNKIVMKSDLSNDTKKDLCLVNKRNLFFTNIDTIGKAYKIPFENIKLGRWIFKHFFGKLPNCRKINMVLQDKIALIETPNKIKHSKFKYVLKLSYGNKKIKGKYINIMINDNSYSNKFNGTLSTSCSLFFENKKLKYVSLTKDIDIIKEELNPIKISFDIGTNILFALNTGECYGKWYMKKLKWLDANLIKIDNDLKIKYGSNVKLNDYKIHNDYVKFIQDFSKNEINRILNKIYKKYKPSEIILENLDFKGSNIGAKNNRMLHRFGLGIIKQKLNQLHVDYQVKITYTDAAYSSQTCNVCGYVDKNNRPSQKEFECKCCGKKINADVNAGRTLNIFNERFGEKMFYNKADRSNKLTLLVENYFNNEVWKDNKRIIQVLINNHYFKNYYSILRENILANLS